MCGRFAIAITVGIEDRFGAKRPPFEIRPRYNIAPSQDVPVVAGDPENPAEREIVPMRWGLIPSWSKDARAGYRMINARAETLADRPAFRSPLKRRRCLVPVTGFYEWKQAGSRKVPYYIDRKDHSLFAFAGLYDIWRDAGGEPVKTFTIITTAANDLIAPIHDRMPVILSRENEDAWMRGGTLEPDELERLLAPYPSHELEAYPVSPAVNNPANEGPDLIARAPGLISG
ncbi:MAG: SOS response-associated peptidase [Methanomicrobiales archaeon]|nr:SOS response-associated peptidase [Methanomicrobiales archaeon]MDI6876259.1 SOS response-associated peptidase [Methanomicrobiales archaeon]